MTEPEQTGMERGEALALAERYAARGIPAFPIAIGWDPEKNKTTKRPLNTNGHVGASTDIKRIRSMFNGANLPDGCAIGVGLHLGPAGMFVLDGDLDGRGDGVAELAAVFARHGIYETVRTITASGGVHAWLGKGTLHVGNSSPYDAIDVRGDDGWVVAPGVVTPWGEWSFDPEHDLWDGCVVTDAPRSLLDELGATDTPTTRQHGPGDRTMPDGLDPRDRAALEALIALGGTYSHRDATSIHVTRPGKIAGTSATIGHIGPGVVKCFTSNWPPMKADRRYDADAVVALARGGTAEGESDAPEADPDTLELALRSLRIIDWAQFWSGETDGPDWLMEPIIAKGRGHALYAGAKSGKSLLMLAACAAIASGKPFLNSPARAPQHVLYLDYEMTEDDLRERLETFGYGPEDDLSHLHYALLPTIDPLDTEMGAAAVLAAAQHYQAVHVVIDTTSRAISGEENSADTFRAFYRLTGLRLKAAGIGYHRLDHSGKDVERGQRGSSAKNDDVDVVQQLVVRDKGAVTLRATHRRMAWVPEAVDITRTDDDGVLAYSTDKPTYPTNTWHVVKWLDDNGIDVKLGRPKVAELLRAAGFGCRNDAISAALKVRRDRDRNDLSLVPNGSGTGPGTATFVTSGTGYGGNGDKLQNPWSAHGDSLGDSAGQVAQAQTDRPPHVVGDGSVPETTPRRTAAELLAGTKLEGLM